MKHGVLKSGLLAGLAGAAALALVLGSGPNVAAQAPQGGGGGRGGGQAGPPPTPQSTATIDLTGYWVSIVNEDWRWRMVTPPKGDFTSVPLNQAGQKMANDWNEATDGSCLAFGAAALLRMPTRLHITWADPNTLKIETDNGEQTRLLHFDNSMQPGAPSLQGYSKAEWVRRAGRGRGGPPPGGSLMVTTTDLSGGWLRRNGVPYSNKTTVTEWFDRFPVPNSGDWFAVTTRVEDPTYLQRPWVTSTHFRKEPDGSKWHPAACKPAA
jgi:hypothetical protein